jgi:hypothetical protein
MVVDAGRFKLDLDPASGRGGSIEALEPAASMYLPSEGEGL